MTAEQLQRATGCGRAVAVAFSGPIAATIQRWGVKRAAEFVAQMAVESALFTRLEENLTYTTPERLMAVWPRRFPTAEAAQPYVRNPQDLANFVYSNRMGNTQYGDGWRFRGRGLKQLTGRNNYTDYQDATGVRAVDSPDILLDPVFAADSAGWFWQANGCDALAGDVEALTRRINGGLTGIEQRVELTDLARGAFA